ncbi:unnamed protein product [Medioppia subpectinata]|uniref:Armadillo repeat-containing protein 7 n=1 Tax=Medioppia subpectinata TaxID=1979941 RepID=A0A7R9KG59_9ACAR|nr:unnamed protein product [Medioppia subpectinata]CAG2102790.1 unnamed protein product [Medioppia subpectinata]
MKRDTKADQTQRYSPSERFDYLQKLLHEFNITNSKEAKRQVLANICSFAYNPINFEALNKLNITTTLLDSLNVKDDKLIEYAISGLCNLSADVKNIQIIINNNGFHKILKCLSKNVSNERIVISSLTLFIFAKQLITKGSPEELFDS